MEGFAPDTGWGPPMDAVWDVRGTPLEPKRRRRGNGVRQPSRQPSAAPGSAADFDTGGSDWPWSAGDESGGGSGDGLQAAAAAGSSGLLERAANVRNPCSEAMSAQEQLKWDDVRPAMQRSYVQHLPGARQLSDAQLEAQRQLMQDSLAAELPCCNRCDSMSMQPEQPATVLYIGSEVRFMLSVPRYRCCEVECGGAFAPSPFSVRCFPATPKVSWDVTQSSTTQPARWIDERLLRLADSLVFQGGRGVAVYTLARVVHGQHALNGCSDPLGWEHLKRQLGEAIMVCAVQRWGGHGNGCPACACGARCSAHTASPPRLPPPTSSPTWRAGIWLSAVRPHAAGQPGRAGHPHRPAGGLPVLWGQQPAPQPQHRLQLWAVPPGALRLGGCPAAAA